MAELCIVLPGRCPTKGSLRPIKRDSGGVYMQDAGLEWQKAAMNALSDAWAGAPLLAEPVTLAVQVRFADRPQNKRSRHWLYPTNRRDTDKLARRIMDCLTSTILQDDQWIIMHTVSKAWGDRDEVQIRLLGTKE